MQIETWAGSFSEPLLNDCNGHQSSGGAKYI